MLRRLDSLLGAVAVLALVVVAAAVGAPFRFEEARGGIPVEMPAVTLTPEAVPPLSPPPPPPAGEEGIPWDVLIAIAFLLVIGVLLVLGARRLWQSRKRRGEQLFESDDVGAEVGAVPPGGVINLPALADAVEEALQRLDDVAEPRDAVVAAWVELEKAAARHGWERDPAQTTTEFTAHLLSVSPAPPQHTAALRGLYQHARFAAHPVTGAEVSAARAALEAIARALEHRRRQDAAPGAGGPAGGTS